jgi:hypothetical protein
VKLFTNCYDITGFNVNCLDIQNICPNKYGLITCYLSNNQIYFFERYNYCRKYKIVVFNKNITDECLSKVCFAKSGHLVYTITNTFRMYIYNFIKLRLIFKLDLNSILTVRNMFLLNDDKIFYIKEKKIYSLDLNKIEI